MSRLQKLRVSRVLKWASSLCAESNFTSQISNVCVNGSYHTFRLLRFHGTKSALNLKNGGNPGEHGKVSPEVREQIQAALMDYFHLSRNLEIIDAENMSKSTPMFFDKLLKEMDIGSAEVGRSVKQFLRCHPINEFEPFFESLGLNPSEYMPFLPRNLMFLADDELLLENYHVLSNYGIGRNRIGKIYKEATEVFRYEHGVLRSKLQSFQNLGLRQSLVAKIIASGPHLLTGNVFSQEFFEFLEKLKNVGVECDFLEEYISEEGSYNWKYMHKTLCLLCEMGLSEKQVGELFKQHPDLLLECSGRITVCLLGLLLKFGSTPSDIQSVFLQFPKISVSQFTYNFRNCYNFLVEIDMPVQDIGVIVRSHPILLGSCELKQASSLMTLMNCRENKLREMIKDDPFSLEKRVLGARVEPLGEPKRVEKFNILKTQFLLRLGFVENSKEMEKALKTIRANGHELEERFDCIVNNGLSRKEVIEMLKVSSQILNQSSDIIETKIRLFVNDLGYRVSDLLSFPKLLSYTIERLKLRLSMYKWLKDKKAVRPNLHLSTLLDNTDEGFVKSCVNSHPQGPAVWKRLKKEIYSGECGKISRDVRKEAQAALIGYFHLTRNLHILDAENMSKNAPEFFNNLLKEVAIDKTRGGDSVMRFLSYNPVYEFEPFFESIGLKPAEYTPFLPKKMMFLADDELLLENYYALCNYGVERNRVGKIYKEATEVFRYDYGVLKSRLRSFENLGLRHSLVAKIVASDPHLLTENVVSQELVNFLETLKKTGIEDHWLEKNIFEEDSYSWKCMNQILCLLYDMGMSKKQVKDLLTKHPDVLLEYSGCRTFHLIGFLLKFGSTMSDVQTLFLQFPQIPVSKFTYNLFNCYKFLAEIDMALPDIGVIVRSFPKMLGSCELKQTHSLVTIMKCGKNRLREIIRDDPFTLEKWVRGVKVERVGGPKRVETVRTLKTQFLLSLGFVENSKEMRKALKEIRGKADELQARFDCLVNIGFSHEQVIKALKLYPQMINQSIDVIETKFHFFVNDLGYRASDLLTHPKVLYYSIERLKLRLLTYKWLQDQGAVRPNLHLSTLLSGSEEEFVKTYVNSHPEGSEFWNKLKEKVDSDNK